MMKSIALIGHGAIARDLVKRVEADPLLRIAQVLVRPGRVAEIQQALGERAEAIGSVDDISPDVDFVLECAGHGALQEHGPGILGRGFDLGVLSVGALANDALRDDLQRASAEGASRLLVVPGAIGGIDAIAAAGPEGLETVTYSGSKAPLSWTGTPAELGHDLSKLTEATEVFSGSAGEAARQFPKNANVVATVALAGLGFERTRVRLVADPRAARNTHHILAEGPDFRFDFTSSGATLPDNPKTSALTSLAAYRVLKNRAYSLCV